MARSPEWSRTRRAMPRPAAPRKGRARPDGTPRARERRARRTPLCAGRRGGISEGMVARDVSIWKFANPARFMGLAGALLPWVSAAAAVTLTLGLVWGFFFTPDDYQQGSTVK